MSKKSAIPTQSPRERAILVGVEIRSEGAVLTLEDSVTELALLASTADLDIVGEVTQKLEKPHPDTYIGAGKVDEIKALLEETLADLVIFDA